MSTKPIVTFKSLINETDELITNCTVRRFSMKSIFYRFIWEILDLTQVRLKEILSIKSKEAEKSH